MIEYGGVGLYAPTEHQEEIFRAWWHPDRILYADFPGTLTAGLAHLPRPYPQRRDPPRLGILHWPCQHASRWATFFHLVGGEQLSRIRTQLGSSNGPISLTVSDDAGRSVTAGMYLLPPRAVGQTGVDEIYLLELVDERYYWWMAGDQHAPSPTATTWTTHISDLFALLGLGPFIDTIPASYDPPDISRWQVGYEPIPVLIDAACKTVGCRVVRTPAGAVKVVRFATAKTALDANVLAYDRDRVIGGRVAPADIGKAVPASVAVIFSNDSVTAALRTLVGIGGIGGFNGVAGRTGLVRADLPSSASASARSNWADEAALDFYRWQQCDWEADYRWAVPWTPTGAEDSVEWESIYTGPDAPLMVTHVRRPPEFDPNLYGGSGLGSGGIFFAKITGNNGSTPLLYSAVEVDLKAADPDTWITKPGGRVIGQWFGHRAPSKNFDHPILPAIPTDQVVLAAPSETKAGHFKLTPWGGQLRVNEKELVDVCVRCRQDEDTGLYFLEIQKVFRFTRRDARDHVRYLGANTDTPDLLPYPP